MPTVTIYHPERPTEILLREHPPSLQELQNWVGGLIQPVYFEDDPCGYWHVGYVNEEGVCMGLAPCPSAAVTFAHYGVLSGPVVALEGFESFWWHDMDTGEPVCPASKGQCLAASNEGIDTRTVDNRLMYLAEKE